MESQVTGKYSKLCFAIVSVFILLLSSCQKEPVAISNNSFRLGSSNYELTNAFYTNNWDSSAFGYMGELILAGPTIYFDRPSGFFNSNGKSAFIVILNSGLGQLKSGDYDLSPSQTMVHVDADPKPTDSTRMRNRFGIVGDVIVGKMRIRQNLNAMRIEIVGSCYVNKIQTDLNISFTGPVNEIPQPYHLVK